MASLQSLDVVARSATTLPTPQVRQAVPQVAKLIDESKCIGCKACQVACMNWNDLRDEVGDTVGVYDNPVDLTPSSWTVMKFYEVEPKAGSLEWLIRKDGCMHCEDPGCLKACPSPGAIVKYANGIVDFVSENCIGCGYCITGCPFDIPRISKKDNKAYKCTLCSDRVAVGQVERGVEAHVVIVFAVTDLAQQAGLAGFPIPAGHVLDIGIDAGHGIQRETRHRLPRRRPRHGGLTMPVALLALGAESHPVGDDAWAAWTATLAPCWRGEGATRHIAFAPLFGHQYSHVWYDFRGIRDEVNRQAGFDYFENSRRATLAHDGLQRLAFFGAHLAQTKRGFVECWSFWCFIAHGAGVSPGLLKILFGGNKPFLRPRASSSTSRTTGSTSSRRRSPTGRPTTSSERSRR